MSSLWTLTFRYLLGCCIIADSHSNISFLIFSRWWRLHGWTNGGNICWTYFNIEYSFIKVIKVSLNTINKDTVGDKYNCCGAVYVDVGDILSYWRITWTQIRQYEMDSSCFFCHHDILLRSRHHKKFSANITTNFAILLIAITFKNFCNFCHMVFYFWNHKTVTRISIFCRSWILLLFYDCFHTHCIGIHLQNCSGNIKSRGRQSNAIFNGTKLHNKYNIKRSSNFNTSTIKFVIFWWYPNRAHLNVNETGKVFWKERYLATTISKTHKQHKLSK